jgi:excisionase family DNA binding protein
MTEATLTPTHNRALSVAEAAAYAGIATGTLRNRIGLGVGPRVQRIGRRVLVRLSDLEAWVASQPASVPRDPSGAGAR